MNHVIFRVDAAPSIGSGHLMRCLVLANELRAHGFAPLFVSRPQAASMEGLVRASGHLMRWLPGGVHAGLERDPPHHASWLGTSQAADASAFLACTGDLPIDLMVVDHYALDHRWETAVRCRAARLLVIDDLADRRHSCDLLLDQNFFPDDPARYEGLVEPTCTMLLGPQYALLRPEFARARKESPLRETSAPVRRLLVMFGGSDEQDLTGRVLNTLTSIDFAGQVDVVAGPMYAHADRLKALVSRTPHATLHITPLNVARLMSLADACVGSPGMTSYERCVAGLPTYAIAVADNQEPLARTLAHRGVISYAGRAEALSAESLKAGLQRFLADTEALQLQRRAAAAVCDGLGAQRVASAILSRPSPSASEDPRMGP